MKLVSTRTELVALQAGCHPNPSVSGTILSSIDESYFYNDHAIEAYGRIQKLLKKTGEVPSWRDICEDPRVSEETRDRLRKFKGDKIRDRKQALQTVRVLNEYRQLRGLFNIAEETFSALRKDKASPTKVLDAIAESTNALRQVKSNDATIVRFGAGNNADSVVSGLLKKESVNFIPTGFEDFDRENGGFGFGNLVTIGGTSGGGKSALASQLGINWSKMGENVCIVPLEMTVPEMTARLMANAAKLDVRKILFQKLSRGEISLYKKAYRKFVMKRKRTNGTLSFFKPKSDMTIEEILACTYTMAPSIIIVDYISLLKGVDGDDQWQKLGAVARYCKIYAETHNVIVVLLCQVGEDGRIRYAQAIKEHCLAGNVYVDTPDGLKTIDSLVDNPETRGPQKLGDAVMSGDITVKTSAWHNNGVKPVYDLVTDTGFRVRATSGHKFLSMNEKTLEITWKRLGNLKTGDRIASSRSSHSVWPNQSKKQWLLPTITSDLHHNTELPEKFPRRLNPELAYFIGGMIADGNTRGMSMVTTSEQEEFVDRMRESYEKNFGENSTRTYRHKTENGHDVTRLFARCTAVAHSFFKINFDGFSGNSSTKFVPSAIMEAPRETAAAFLCGLFDGDGTVSGNSLALDTISEELLHRTKLLLLKFGIHSIVARKNRLTINSLDSQKQFAAEIGFTVYSKMARLLMIIEQKENARAKQPRQSEFRTLYQRAVGRAASIVDKNIVTRNMQESEHFDWVRVKSIDYAGRQPVYDITVPDTANYVANGLVVHNSNYSWVFVSTKETREAEIINIRQLKARNGQLYDFMLKARLDMMRIRSMTNEEKKVAQSGANTKKGGKPEKEGKSPGYLKDISDDEE